MVPFYYYVLSIPVFALLGLLSHLSRGVFNLYPDRGYTNTPREDYSFTDDVLSGNYSFKDYLLGTEYDENGYYDLASLRNLRIACQFSIAGGLVCLIALPHLAELFRMAVDATAQWLWNLFLFRLSTMKLF